MGVHGRGSSRPRGLRGLGSRGIGFKAKASERIDTVCTVLKP